MTKEIIIEYKGVEFNISYDWTVEDDGVQHVEQINEITHKGTCFYELLESDIDTGKIEEAIDEELISRSEH